MGKGEKESTNIASTSGKFIFQLSLADALRLTMFGTIIALTNDIARIPLHLPGNSSLFWMGILVLGAGLIPRFGAGTVMGIVSGILAALLALGNEGVFVFFRYLAPGVLLDLVALLFNNKLALPVVGAVCGALISLAKMLVNLALGLLLHLPMAFLVIGLGFVSVTHAFFGAAGGIIASLLIKLLKPRMVTWD